MLKNIGILFEKRKNFFSRSQDKTSQIKNLLKCFLEEKFGEALKGYSFGVDYNSRENSLVITAESKTIANELTDRKSTRLNSSHSRASRMPSSA